MLADATGEPNTAFTLLSDARQRAGRHSDPYVWLDAYVLDAQCTLGRRHGHSQTRGWVAELRQLADRTGMRDFSLRSLLHGAALGSQADAAAAQLLALEFDAALTGHG